MANWPFGVGDPLEETYGDIDYNVKRPKPVVRYGALLYLHIGHSALLDKVIRHPDIEVTGYGIVRTSPVVRLLGGGKFETENTVYEPLRKTKLRNKRG